MLRILLASWCCKLQPAVFDLYWGQKSWIWVSSMAQEIRARHQEFPGGICLQQTPYKQKTWNKMNSVSYLWFPLGELAYWTLEWLRFSTGSQQPYSRSSAFQVIRIKIEADTDTELSHGLLPFLHYLTPSLPSHRLLQVPILWWGCRNWIRQRICSRCQFT